MAVVVETVTSLAHEVPYRQVDMPSYLIGTYSANDVDNHDFKADARGKGRLTVAVDNPANKSVVVDIYGMHSATGTVGDVGTFVIATAAMTIANAAKDYETVADPFPFYLVRCTHSEVPTDDPLKTVTIYIDFSAF